MRSKPRSRFPGYVLNIFPSFFSPENRSIGVRRRQGPGGARSADKGAAGGGEEEEAGGAEATREFPIIAQLEKCLNLFYPFFSWFEFYGQASSSSSFFVGNEMGGSFRGDELPGKGVLDSRMDKKRGWLWVHSKKGSFPSFPFPYI